MDYIKIEKKRNDDLWFKWREKYKVWKRVNTDSDEAAISKGRERHSELDIEREGERKKP